MENITSEIKVIKNDLAYIRQFIEEDRNKYDEHVRTSQVFRDKVLKLESVRQDLKNHMASDKWIHGTLLVVTTSTFLGILYKIMNP